MQRSTSSFFCGEKYGCAQTKKEDTQT